MSKNNSFLKSIHKEAKKLKSRAEWMYAGIVLNKKHFETYSNEENMKLELGKGFYIEHLDVLLKTKREAEYYLQNNYTDLIGKDLSNFKIKEVDILIDVGGLRAWVIQLLTPPLEFDDYYVQSDDDLKKENALNKLSYEEQALLGLIK